MKQYIQLTTILGSLFLVSCGEDKSENSSSKSTATQEIQQSSSHQAIKDALKSQVNATSADLMVKMPSFADLPPAIFEIPDSLEGREMVQVTVRWTFLSKTDLYVMNEVLDELPDKPVVVEQVYKKGDLLDYVEANFVLQADGGGGYILSNSRFVKQNFTFAQLNERAKMGKVTLIRGSNKHLEASKMVAAIKQEAEEKQRLEQLEAAKAKQAEAKAKREQLIPVIEKSGKFEGSLTAQRNGNSVTEFFELTIEDIQEKAGDTLVKAKVLQYFKGKEKQVFAQFTGKFDESGNLVLVNVAPGRNTGWSQIWDLVDIANSRMTLHPAGHVDKVKITSKVGRYEISGELIRE